MNPIVFDVDGTVLDLITPWLSRYRDVCGHEIYPDDVTVWEVPVIANQLPYEWHLATVTDPSIYAEVRPIEGVVSVIRKLRERGNTVLFCSDTYPAIMQAKITHLRRLSLLAYESDYISAAAAHKKLIRARSFVEDRASTALSLPTGVLYVQPWNDDELHIGSIPCIVSWLDTALAIDILENSYT